MNKLFPVILVVFGLLLPGCDDRKNYTVSVINKTDKTVWYDYNGASRSVAPDRTRTHTVKAYTPAPENVRDDRDKGIANITMENWQGEKYTFKPAKAINLHVINSLPITVTIVAGNYIDNGASVPADRTALTLGPSNSADAADAEKEAIIYTKKPKFGAITELHYPVVIDWRLIEADEDEDEDPDADEELDTIVVIIR
ncbi:MAG: hypothetical protein FWD36_08825 [Treponema sp.]|nr:hypothetical protein [Treponema sp.]